ncbi:uncharacterized protein LOC143239034 isoform X3 [Tachypleus tridentatus]|uniref:uncharacterized protein LOC143239034 isoform X3 n=1 Tax=Tachypleus tridentatus TaxID=6853 RepID=UPI003FD1F783
MFYKVLLGSTDHYFKENCWISSGKVRSRNDEVGGYSQYLHVPSEGLLTGFIRHKFDRRHKYPCPMCGKLFKEKRYLWQHLSIHLRKLLLEVVTDLLWTVFSLVACSP